MDSGELKIITLLKKLKLDNKSFSVHHNHKPESKNIEFGDRKLEDELANALQVIEELKVQNIQLQQFIVEQQKKQKLASRQKVPTIFVAAMTVMISIFVTAIGSSIIYKRSFSTSDSSVSIVESTSKDIDSSETIAVVEPVATEPYYNVKTAADLQLSKELQQIVDEAVDFARQKGKPIKPLSISLIDVNTGEFAEYHQDRLRYPASVVKLFWMVMLYAQLESGEIEDEVSFKTDIIDTIQKSDNESASRILDLITNTRSGSFLEADDYQQWKGDRESVNRFFRSSDYQDINISQKTFPIPYLNLYELKGRDLQIRENSEQPIRNKISTQQASRLLYEIATGQAISSEHSQKMLDLLTIDAPTRRNKKNLKNPNYFNSVRGFFSQSLPDDIHYAAKAGWTSKTRHETAYVATPDGTTRYILTIFAEDKTYSKDWNIFPQISQLVFKRMTASSE